MTIKKIKEDQLISFYEKTDSAIKKIKKKYPKNFKSWKASRMSMEVYYNNEYIIAVRKYSGKDGKENRFIYRVTDKQFVGDGIIKQDTLKQIVENILTK